MICGGSYKPTAVSCKVEWIRLTRGYKIVSNMGKGDQGVREAMYVFILCRQNHPRSVDRFVSGWMDGRTRPLIESLVRD